MLDQMALGALAFVQARLGAEDEGGQSLTEYALILALVAVVAIGVLTTMGGRIVSKFQQIVNALT